LESPAHPGRKLENPPSNARVAAGAFGFLIFNHAFDRPDLYGASGFFEPMPFGARTWDGAHRHGPQYDRSCRIPPFYF
jgi:hypothetical protein